MSSESNPPTIHPVSTALLKFGRAAAIWSLAAMVMVSLVDVIGRNLGHPLPGASEIVSLLLGFTFFGGMALASHEDGHIILGLSVDRFSPKLKKLEGLFSKAVSVACFVLIAWMSLHEAQTLQKNAFRTEFLELPLWWVIYGLLVVALISVVFSITASSREGREH